MRRHTCGLTCGVLSQDVLGNLRPQLARYTRFEEAYEAVAAIEAAEAAAKAAGLPAEESDSDESDTRRLGIDSEDGMACATLRTQYTAAIGLYCIDILGALVYCQTSHE